MITGPTLALVHSTRRRDPKPLWKPLFVAVDGEDAAHYWDRYEFAVTVVVAEKVELPEAPFEMLSEWCKYTRGERG